MTLVAASIASVLTVFAAYFSIWLGWALLLLTTAAITFPSLAAIKGCKWDHVPDLSSAANALLQRYGHFYSLPAGSADFASAAKVVSVAAAIVGILGLSRSIYWPMAVAVAWVVAMRVLARKLNPIHVLHSPNNRAAHDELVEWVISQRTRSAQ